MFCNLTLVATRVADRLAYLAPSRPPGDREPTIATLADAAE